MIDNPGSDVGMNTWSSRVVHATLAAGRYAVTVHLIDWESDPESVDADGRPVPAALPDFVLEIRSEPTSAPAYRTAVETFPR